MSGFPREARVPSARGHATPQRMCNMTACNTFRSFAICLIIAIIITESPTSGFTIRRANINDKHEPDLIAEESSLLEVKHDLNRPNGIYSDSHTKIDGTDKLLALESVTNKSIASEDVLLNSSLISVDENTAPNKTSTKTNKITEVNEANLQSNVTNESKNNFRFNARYKSTPLSNTSSSEDVSELSKDISSTSPYTQEAYSTTTIRIKSTQAPSTTTNIPKLIITGVLNFQSNSGTENTSKKGKQTPQKDFVRFITEIKNNKSSKDASEVTTSMPLVSTNAAEDSMAKPSVTVDTTIDIDNDITSTKYINKLFSSAEVTHTPVKINTSLFQITRSTDLVTDGTSLSLDNTEQFSETMTVAQTSSVMTEPLMKKYTEIDRRRLATTTDENTSPTTNNDMVNADNIRARVSLEKVFSATPIPSLENLKQDLMSSPTQPSTGNQTIAEVVQQTEDDQTSTFSTDSFSITPRREMVSSMRAGFLDLTAKTEESRGLIAVTDTSVNNINHGETPGALYDIESDGIGNKTENGMESQSQLAEDAIKEELLKEEMLNDNEDNAERHHDDFSNPEGIRLLDEIIKEPKISQENASDDSLSVKPISQDKSKLYAVSPNYKPMKKIDVQPSKQFVRDPDDNSWRNESISSLGIVFKPKNSSKSFTQVLKNKTEVEFINLSDRNKNDLPELRERLEKIAEVRKSKKKRIDKFGETIYTDYEENSASGESLRETPKVENAHELLNFLTETALLSTSIKPTSSSLSKVDPVVTTTDTTSTTEGAGKAKQEGLDVHSTRKPNKFYNIAEYYDTTDEYDTDYVHLSKIDLKKFPTPFKAKEPGVTPPAEFPQTKSTYPPDRKATLQYFPPRLPPKVKYNAYDDNFQKKVNEYPYRHSGGSFGTVPTVPVQANKIEQADREYSVKPLHYTHMYKPIDITKNLYLTSPPRVTDPRNGYGSVNDGNYDRPAYIIKHFNQDFISDSKDNDDEKTPDFLFTEPPVRGVTINDLEKPANKIKLPSDDDYDYDTQFRKDIMNRFVDNFNQNSERYKVDFPILYNNSVVHRKVHENGKSLASSSAFMKRLYNDVTAAKVNNYFVRDKPCDPHCDNITVELSPAYELHYYVPDQEEKEEVEQRPTLPYRFRL